MQTGNYQALAVILLLLHPLCFLLSFLLFDRCEFKTPKLKKRLMRKSLVANAAINISLLFFCPALLFPGRGAGGIVADGVNIAVEVRSDHPHKLVEEVTAMENIYSVSLVEHDGEVTA